ncbi:LOW QUALITY PROTEIN: hypothetical protein Cgig2_021549 [Carnegiea gigantea]|uniref:Uncharacterized protein n=1 Tax=Carnegiea gigantea TaxID=171969 RepID=A0A9Q1KAM5_9CARY|nr:LOW QUALITY PROTEIN: hypothetical protein Cgig2_021549 [Carnegiea gigantea]
MVEGEGIVWVFDIDPTPAPTYTPQSTYMISADVTNVCYVGRTTHTCSSYVKEGLQVSFDINFTPLEELDGVMYDIHAMRMMSPDAMPLGVPTATREDVRATPLEYFYTEPIGFVEGVSVVWDPAKVALTGLSSDNYFVSFYVKARETVYRHRPNPVHYANRASVGVVIYSSVLCRTL